MRRDVRRSAVWSAGPVSVMAALMVWASLSLPSRAADPTLAPGVNAAAGASPSGAGPSPAPMASIDAPGQQSIEEMPIEGFVPIPDVVMVGSEHAASIYSGLPCDALTGWLQIGDWRLDAAWAPPLPSTAPPQASGAPEGLSLARIEWLAMSHGEDVAIVRLGNQEGDPGCRGLVSLLSRQTLTASGPYDADTSALTYQAVCAAGLELRTAQAKILYMGDDGTVAFMTVHVPLEQGTHHVTDADLLIGGMKLSPSDLPGGLLSDQNAVQRLNRKLQAFEKQSPESSDVVGDVSVESVDPLVATVDLTGLQDAKGKTERLHATFRCDLPGGQLSDAAAAATPSPAPVITPPPGSHIEVTIGSGSKAFHQVIDDAAASCTLGIFGPRRWLLGYSPSEAKRGEISHLDLTTGGSDAPILNVDIDPNIFYTLTPTQGRLKASVDDRGSEVGFTAHGRTSHGQRLTLDVTCRSVERL